MEIIPSERLHVCSSPFAPAIIERVAMCVHNLYDFLLLLVSSLQQLLPRRSPQTEVIALNVMVVIFNWSNLFRYLFSCSSMKSYKRVNVKFSSWLQPAHVCVSCSSVRDRRDTEIIPPSVTFGKWSRRQENVLRWRERRKKFFIKLNSFVLLQKPFLFLPRCCWEALDEFPSGLTSHRPEERHRRELFPLDWRFIKK